NPENPFAARRKDRNLFDTGRRYTYTIPAVWSPVFPIAEPSFHTENLSFAVISAMRLSFRHHWAAQSQPA
ncbi:MAG TPA: hypothetical protein VMA13_11060, partial [Candidatus Saccharimonadales bacterium]|nr:hypothetical protein [Candidatus Saccharimonadales bacterium]